MRSPQACPGPAHGPGCPKKCLPRPQQKQPPASQVKVILSSLNYIRRLEQAFLLLVLDLEDPLNNAFHILITKSNELITVL